MHKENIDYLDFEKIKMVTGTIINAEINKIERQIDQMVYELYGLTEDEIEIVENATKI